VTLSLYISKKTLKFSAQLGGTSSKLCTSTIVSLRL
jgi:hypothetical protein